jgi:TrmH family RNA methyltransferase
MGAQFTHRAFQAELSELAAFLVREKIVLWATAASGQPLDRTKAPPRLAVAVGNEGAGLSSEVLARAQQTVSLPIAGIVESLNVAVATAIFLYELRS